MNMTKEEFIKLFRKTVRANKKDKWVMRGGYGAMRSFQACNHPYGHCPITYVAGKVVPQFSHDINDAGDFEFARKALKIGKRDTTFILDCADIATEDLKPEKKAYRKRLLRVVQ